jgi:hypothetical protein
MGASPCTLPSRRSCSAASTLVDAAGLLAIDDPSSCLLLSSFFFFFFFSMRTTVAAVETTGKISYSFCLPACLPACTFVLIFFILPPFLFFYYSHSDISFHSRESWGFLRRPDAVKREQSTRLHCLKRQKTFTQSASTTLRAATIMKKERKNGNG